MNIQHNLTKWSSGMICVASVAVVSVGVGCKSQDQTEVNKQKLELVGYEFNQEGFFKAAAQDDLQALNIFKEQKFDMRVRNLLGQTAVHAAAEAGAVRALAFLQKNKQDLDVNDKHLVTPLMLAAKKGNNDAVRFLLNAKVSTLRRDDVRKFALLYAIDGDSIEAIHLIAPHNRELLDTALLYASVQNRFEAIEPLVQMGASVYARNDGKTALMLAAEKGHDRVVANLIDQGANVYAVSENIPEIEGSGGKLARDLAVQHPAVIAILDESNNEKEDETMSLEWSDEELADVVKKAMLRYDENTMKQLVDDQSKMDDEGLPVKVKLPELKAPEKVAVNSIKGKTLALKNIEGGVSVLGYAEKPLPLVMHGEEGAVVVKDLRKGNAEIGVQEGEEIPMTGLKVKQIKKKIVNGKMTGGRDMELVTLTVEDEKTGVTREIYSGYESTAADAVAVVKLNDTGELMIVRRGDTFTDSNGVLYKVEDVNEQVVIVENTKTNKQTALRLLGIKHQ